MANEGQVTIGTTAASIVQGYPNGGVVIQNAGSVTLYVGTDANLTATNGIGLAGASGGTPGGALTVNSPSNKPGDTWYGVVASGTTQANWLLE